ncbi:uncharacterized protein LOC112596641 [Melanaphis sacchari]|uniref:uncharacterized protein LOC112596641 n=1 Tax=Melanaphis sacchari TaxID=742174 RepID=UPI000DC13164|nr:uncharacterized protein LOC112596641 [Melanaphis sacchari]
MSNLLKEWLIHQLGVEVNSLHSNNLSSKFQNGMLIGKILLNYGLVSSKEFSLLINQEDEVTKKSNFRHLEMWLNMLHIPLDKDTINGIIHGESSIIIAFLYKLCFLLKSPSDLNIIGQIKKFYKSLGGYDLSNGLFTSGKIVNFSHKKPQSIQKHIDKKTDGNHSIPHTLDKIAYFECSLSQKINRWAARGDQSCNRYLFDIKNRKEHAKIYESWRKETINKYLTNNLKKNNRHNQDVLRNKSILNRLNCMSDCEEQLVNKIDDMRIATKKLKTFIAKNDVEFVENNIVHKKYEMSEENKLNMKKKLVERNKDLKNNEKTVIMKSVVRDLIDLGIRTAVYKKAYDHNISKYLRSNWMHMFIEGRPLLNTLDDRLGLLLDNVYVAENKPYTDEELKTQSILNHKDVMEYLERTNGWSEKELGLKSDSHTTVSRALGFLVYDVFTLYYTLPPSSITVDDFVIGPVFGVLSCEMENSFKQDICNALIKRNILPVLPIAALQYCSRAYCQLTDNDELIEILDDSDDLDEPNDLDKYIIFDNKFVNKNPTLLNEVQKSKQTQTNWKFEKYHELVECGKTAYLHIYRGKPLPKYCLIDCVLYYIKAKKVLGGCVFIGFSKENIITLEERLSNRNSPPFGTHDFMKDINPTILAPFKGPDLVGIGRYETSFTRYLKIVSDEYKLDTFCDLHEYYKSHNILTFLQSKYKNIDFDEHKIELLCNALAGQHVNWSEQNKWVNCIYDMHNDQVQYETQKNSSKYNSVQPIKVQKSVFKRKRLHGKSEFEYLDYISSSKVNMITNEFVDSVTVITKPEEVKSKLFNVQINAEIGAVLVQFWMLMENNFVQNMEWCFFHRRILIYNQMPYMASINNYINEILKRQNVEKIELVKVLQSDLLKIPNDALMSSDLITQLLSTVEDTKFILTELTNHKIKDCKQFIKNENIDRSLDNTMNSMILVYKHMLQTEVDRTVNTILFIHSYMSKVYNKKLTLSIIPNHIVVSLSKEQEFKSKGVEQMASVEYYYKWFDATVIMVQNKLRGTLKSTYEWLAEMKKIHSENSLESSNIYLKIWKFLVDKENFRSIDQLKLILTRFHEDIKEMESYITQHKLDMNRRIDECSQKEIYAIECICNLFKSAINEKQYVRHEIIVVNNNFYINAENVLQPSNPPPYPFPLLEPEDICIVTIHNLKEITNQLIAICPNKRISIVALSSCLKSYLKHHPEIEWFNTAHFVLRTMFGLNVNFIDWSDFILHCLELPYPNVDDLLYLKNQYLELEKKKQKDPSQNYIEGTIDKDEFDSVLLWYQKTLPPNPSIHFRFIKIKELLFKIFSVDGKLDYIAMLLVLCKDNNSIMGLIKAINLITNQNIMNDEFDNSNLMNERHSINLPIETLYKILMICLKNYKDPNNSDIEDLATSILNIDSNMLQDNGDMYSVLKLLQNDKLKSVSEIGFRFNSRPLSSIVNSLK